jgi:hypothetical protein
LSDLAQPPVPPVRYGQPWRIVTIRAREFKGFLVGRGLAPLGNEEPTMKNKSLATLIFLNVMLIILMTAIVTGGPVGVFPLSLTILETYGLIRVMVRRQKVAKGAMRATALTVAALAIPMLTFLVWLWSIKLDLSFQLGGAVWLGIMAVLEHGLLMASRWNEDRKASPMIHSLVEPGQAA